MNDGGPAFPETRWDDRTRTEMQWTGMSLRDYFAGEVLASNRQFALTDPDYIAVACYHLADAMLKARER